MEYMKCSILGVPVDAVTMGEAVEMAEKMLLGGKQNKIFTSNAEILLEASRDDNYRDILRLSDLSLPETGPVLLGKMIGIPFKGRVAGGGFLGKTIERSAQQRQKEF